MSSILNMKQTLNAHEFSDALKAQGPLSFWEPGQFWLVTDYLLAKSVLADERFSANRTPFFIRRMPDINPAVIDIFLPLVQDMMVMSDAKDHQNRRRICFHAFKPFMQQSLIPMISSKLDELIADKDRIDLVTDVAEPISMFMLAKMFAIPEEDQPEFFRHAKNMTLFFGGATAYNNDTGASVNESAKVLLQYFTHLFSSSRHNATTPFVDILMQFQAEYELSLQALAAQAIMMFVAGQVTTTDQICHDAFQLMQDDVWENIKALPEKLPEYVREATRLDPAVTFLFRVAKEDVDLSGYCIKAGDAVFIANHTVNRCGKMFESPHQMMVDRPAQSIFSYGFGSHYCLGEKLGTLQIETIMDYFLRLERPFKLLHQECVRNHYSLAFSGFKSMPMERNGQM